VPPSIAQQCAEANPPSLSRAQRNGRAR
jgi:hypothetical protein